MNKEIEYVMTVRDEINKTEKKICITSALPVHSKEDKEGFFVLVRSVVEQMLSETATSIKIDLETLEEAAKNADKKLTKQI